MSKLFKILCVLLIVGCQKKIDTHEKPTFDLNLNPDGKAISGTYEKQDIESSESENQLVAKNFNYKDLHITQQETYFFLDNNPCIFDTYFMGVLTAVENNDRYILEISSHCMERDLHNRTNGGVVQLNHDDILFEGLDNAEFFDLVKIYYEFPSDFEPTSYLDYLNYATKIEVAE
ncbi:hypothetical protein [Anaerorhabdus sp.]|uniref:hypothetical protein n=1 Tax=Anaerorhabdus sp. TaxID=1872524 RepID=UPI002FC5A98A